MIFILRHNVAAGNKLRDVDHAVESRVNQQAGDKAICGAVSERYEHDCDECWDGVADVAPVDGYDLAHHKTSDLTRVSKGWLASFEILTRIKVQPVAQGGIEAKIGAKNMAMRKHMPAVMAVSPVFPPSAMPAPDSMNAVTGETPRSAPTDILKASVQ
jgi:hypothetical protein